ncbi:hypothetical protein I6N90_14660 [Paenibacillus sp. GSMTC-2017]|uniref:M60 family metallopeptidase n=1 Tax=Paenibacillus sp. GSMTC-2017 TaxID=2794350 RepID=UPI0018DA0CBA|nr:M60 family metallopeptidase [Paenibacillus sp. GSMTC-2017]MBH5319045.1 hypothetical protein [Paenibacillus sp. GSMTC-2017]
MMYNSKWKHGVIQSFLAVSLVFSVTSGVGIPKASANVSQQTLLEWKSSKTYKKSDRVSYKGYEYVAGRNTKGDRPDRPGRYGYVNPWKMVGKVKEPVIVDVIPPTVSLSSNNVQFNTDDTLLLQSSANDASGISKVEFYQNNTLIHTASSAPFEYRLGITKELNGEHSFVAKAFDTIGNTASSSPVNIHVQIANKVPESNIRTITFEQFGNPRAETRALRREFKGSNIQPTGIYVKPNEVITVTLTTMDATKLPIAAIEDPHITKYNYMPEYITLQPGENKLSSPAGGLLYLQHFAIFPVAPTVTVEGGQDIPYFELGKTTNEEWQKMLNQPDVSPWTELISDRVWITVQTSKAKQYVQDATLLMEAHDRVVAEQEKISGLSFENAKPHQGPKYRFHYKEYFSDDQYMFAWYDIAGFHTDSIDAILDINRFTKEGWGPWHELGHFHQQNPWTWDGMDEVTVNIYSLATQKMFGLQSRLEKDGVYEKAFEYLNQPTRDYNKLEDLFVKVTMLWQLQLAYGDQFYPELHKAYRDMNYNQLPQTDEDMISMFIVMTSKTANQNLIPFFEKWGLNADEETIKFINELGLPTLTAEIWKNRDSNNNILPNR